MKTGLAIQNEAWRAFDAWYAEQDDEVQDMEIQDAIELYSRRRPVVAKQQPARKADAFRNTFAILHNLSLYELNEAGIITGVNALNNKQWDRFNDDLTTFVLKLDDARLDALYALVQSRQPERYRDADHKAQ
jgi:hypothetical protein